MMRSEYSFCTVLVKVLVMAVGTVCTWLLSLSTTCGWKMGGRKTKQRQDVRVMSWGMEGKMS
jgi:hypothetical protein